MSDADCTPGREPRSIAASSLLSVDTLDNFWPTTCARIKSSHGHTHTHTDLFNIFLWSSNLYKNSHCLTVNWTWYLTVSPLLCQKWCIWNRLSWNSNVVCSGYATSVGRFLSHVFVHYSTVRLHCSFMNGGSDFVQGWLTSTCKLSFSWPPCIADVDIVFLPCGFFYLLFSFLA